MTTREEMAMQFVSSLLSNPRIAEAMSEAKKEMTPDEIKEFDLKILPRSTAVAAVRYADALLEALGEPRRTGHGW